MKFNSEKGQALILITFGIIALIGFTALAVDGGRAFEDNRHAQNAADAAALAGSLAYQRNQNLTTAAQDRATSNGYDDNGTTNDVTITATNTPSGVCPSTGKDITVTIVSHVPTTFARVLGRTELVNTVTATARSCDLYVTGGSPLYAGNAIFATRTSACGNGVNDKAIYVGGSSQVQLWGGGVGSASADGGCLHFKGGEAQFKLSETSPKTCANISTAASSGGTFNSVSGQDGCGKKIYNTSFAAPPADLGITCSTNATWSGSTMTPGNYTGSFPPPGVKTLQPGTYCITGDFTLNGNAKLTGNGVTIVMKNGGIKWNGNMELTLTPPTSGDYKGLTIYAPPSNSSQMTLNGSANVVLKGTMLAQNAPCDFIGSGQIQKVTLQMICYTWQMNGNAQAEIMYDASMLYAPQTTDLPTISLLE